MSIHLTPEQQSVIEQAIQAGQVRSVDEFLQSAVAALAGQASVFDKANARAAGDSIRELRKGVTFGLKGQSIRELAHTGHKY